MSFKRNQISFTKKLKKKERKNPEINVCFYLFCKDVIAFILYFSLEIFSFKTLISY